MTETEKNTSNNEMSLFNEKLQSKYP